VLVGEVKEVSPVAVPLPDISAKILSILVFMFPAVAEIVLAPKK
jgi:hypothetical protein